MQKEAKSKKRILEGTVTSDKMKDTIVVKVDRYVQMSKYQKFVTISKKYKAHDEGNICKVVEVYVLI